MPNFPNTNPSTLPVNRGVMNMAPITIDDVDIHHTSLSPEARVGLALARDKVERYVAKGRPLEAQGARSAITIIYQALLGHRDIDTGWGEL